MSKPSEKTEKISQRVWNAYLSSARTGITDQLLFTSRTEAIQYLINTANDVYDITLTPDDFEQMNQHAWKAQIPINTESTFAVITHDPVYNTGNVKDDE